MGKTAKSGTFAKTGLIWAILLLSWLASTSHGFSVVSAVYKSEVHQLILALDGPKDSTLTNHFGILNFFIQGGTEFVGLPTPWQDIAQPFETATVVIPISADAYTLFDFWPGARTDLMLQVGQAVFWPLSGGMPNSGQTIGVFYDDGTTVPFTGDPTDTTGNGPFPQGTHLTWSNYDFGTGILMLEFNEPVWDSYRGTGRISIHTPVNVLRPEVELRAPFDETGLENPNDRQVFIKLSLVQQLALDIFKNRAQDLVMDIDENMFRSITEIPNIPIMGYSLVGFRDPFMSEDMLLIRADMDTSSGVLILEFNHPVNDQATNFNGRLEILNSLNNTSVVIPVPWQNVSPGPQDGEIWIPLEGPPGDKVEAMILRGEEIHLNLASDIFKSDQGKPNVKEDRFWIAPVGHFATSMQLTWAAFNPQQNYLILQFNRDLDDNTTRKDGQIRLFNESGTESFLIPLPWSEISPIGGDWEAVIRIRDAEAGIINAWTAAAGMIKMNIEPGVFHTWEGGLGNLEETNYPVWIGDFRPYSENFNLVEAAFDPVGDVLSLRFTKPLADSLTRLADAMIQLRSLDESGSGLTLHSPLKENSFPNDDIVYIPVGPDQASVIERWPNPQGSLRITIPGNTFTGRENGMTNEEILDHPLNYGYKILSNGPGPSPDSTKAELNAVYNAVENNLYLFWNRPITDALTNKSGLIKLSIDNGGPFTWTLNAPWRDSSLTANDGEIVIPVGGTWASVFEPNMYPGMNLEISLESGIFVFGDTAKKSPFIGWPEHHFAGYIPDSTSGPGKPDDFKGEIRIDDKNGFTRVPTVRLRHNIPAAAQMRISVGAGDTAAAVWVPFDTTVNVNVSKGGDGLKIVLMQFREGTKTSPWLRDSTLYDATRPVMTFAMDTSFTYASWRDTLRGGLSDNVSGPAFLLYTLYRGHDGQYFSSTGWKNAPDTSFLAAQGFWQIVVPRTAMVPGTYILSLSGTDRAGNMGLWKNYSFRLVNSAVILSSEVSGGAARFTVGSESGTAAVQHSLIRTGTSSNAVYSNRDLSGKTASFYPLPDGDYTFRAWTSGQAMPAKYQFQVTGVTSRVFKANEWMMMSVLEKAASPAFLGKRAFLASWHDDLTMGHPIYGKYLTTEAITSLTRGSGYWLLLDTAVAMKTSESELLDQPFEMKLVKGALGWNQVGNPYPYPIDVRAASGGAQANAGGSDLTFWYWDPFAADVLDAGGILRPGVAYWTEVAEPRTITLQPKPYFPGASGGTLSKTSGGIAGDAEWSLQLVIKAGKYEDKHNYLGLRSSLTKSSRNLAEPPKMGKHVSLFFVNPSDEFSPASGQVPPGPLRGRDASQTPDHGLAPTHTTPSGGRGGLARHYTTDFRTGIDPDEAWFDFGAKSADIGPKTAELSVEGLERHVESGSYLFLVDKGEAQPVEPGTPILMKLTSEEHYYSLVITTNPDFSSQLQTKFYLARNYPNPARFGTTFRFTLPSRFGDQGQRITEGYDVRIDLYDLNGLRVSTLFNGRLEPGSHEYAWRRPVSLPGGNYIYRVKAGEFRGSGKIVLTR